MSNLQKMLQIAGISESGISQLTEQTQIITEASYAEILWKMDKWMPGDSEIQDEYYEINSVEEMQDFLENTADEGELRRFGFNGNWKALAKVALRKR